MSESNPYRDGDELVFTPDQRTIGWHQHAFDRWQVYPGYQGLVTNIDGQCVTLDGKSDAAMHWSQFRRASEVTARDREQMLAEYERNVK